LLLPSPIIAEASLRRLLRAAAEGGLCPPRKGERS
jgi:hypothetical protein